MGYFGTQCKRLCLCALLDQNQRTCHWQGCTITLGLDVPLGAVWAGGGAPLVTNMACFGPLTANALEQRLFAHLFVYRSQQDESSTVMGVTEHSGNNA